MPSAFFSDRNSWRIQNAETFFFENIASDFVKRWKGQCNVVLLQVSYLFFLANSSNKLGQDIAPLNLSQMHTNFVGESEINQINMFYNWLFCNIIEGQKKIMKVITQIFPVFRGHEVRNSFILGAKSLMNSHYIFILTLVI